MKTPAASLNLILSLAGAALFVSLPLPGRALAATLAPPPVTVLRSSGNLANGLIFISPQGSAQADPAHPIGQGPEIIDNLGRPVWFNPVAATGGVSALDFRVQTYQGQPVLTWFQGAAYNAKGAVAGTDYILDRTYNLIATVRAGNGLDADEHEFLITPQNTALISIYHLVSADLSSVGGATNGMAYEGVVQEIDIATGRVLLEWHSLPDVPVTDSYLAIPPASASNAGYDYFHLNSVNLDTDGNLLVSSRHTWTVYKINRATGALMWKLGGKRSDFALGSGLPFAWQHNAMAVDANTIRIFDNESNRTSVLPYSRVIWVQRDETAMTASVVRSIMHPDALSSAFMGNAQSLDNSDTFVGWGASARFSEFDANGQLVFDAAEPSGYNSYRSYRFPWVGRPTSDPTAVAQLNADGSLSVHAVWNGATEVATWRVLGGSAPGSLMPIAVASWNGLDTAIAVPAEIPYVQVVALDAVGATIGSSAAVAVPVPAGIPTVVAASLAQTVAGGATAVLSARVSNASGLKYQWYRNDTAVRGATNPSLVIGNTTAADAGTYVLTATNANGSAIISATTLTVSTTATVSRLGNFSVLSKTGAGSDPLIAGFALGGAGTSGSSTLLARASGPALAPFGVSGALADPTLTLFSGPAPITANDNWNSSPSNGFAVTAAAAATGAFSFTNPNSLDSALVTTLPASDYTALVGGNGRASGLVLFELYDATAAAFPHAPRLTNLSVRGRAGSGANILAAGFVVQGGTSKTVLIRAAGPALQAFGVTGVLRDPQVALHATIGGQDTVLATNAGWNGSPSLTAAGNAVGAFALSNPASADSAVLVTLPPGTYTVSVSSVSGSTGVVLLEVYDVP